MALKNLTIENARLFSKDFTGEKNKFNNDRTFCVILDPEIAEKLTVDGWPVKKLEPRNDEEEGVFFLRVKVTFGKIPPTIVIISGGRKKELNEHTVEMLNWLFFDNIDLQIRPYEYDFNGKSGVKPYLKSFWGTVREDDLENKYRDIPYANEKEQTETEDMPFN